MVIGSTKQKIRILQSKLQELQPWATSLLAQILTVTHQVQTVNDLTPRDHIISNKSISKIHTAHNRA